MAGGLLRGGFGCDEAELLVEEASIVLVEGRRVRGLPILGAEGRGVWGHESVAAVTLLEVSASFFLAGSLESILFRRLVV